MNLTRFAVTVAAGLCISSAQPQEGAIHPRVREVTEGVSEARIEGIIKKLVSFETRHLFTSQDDPVHGIGAARKWILSEMQSYSPRLQVRFEHFRVKKQDKSRLFRDVDLYNVVAVLPGKTMPETRVLITGHYDSLHIVRRPGASTAPDPNNPGTVPNDADWEKVDVPAPGANDDGSGTAAVMELARVMSQHEYEKTLVFIAFAGEEEGLIGSTLAAAKAREEKLAIEAQLNNDIIGGDTAGNGRANNTAVNVFGSDATDSPSQELARYARMVGERYLPGMKVNSIFLQDRFGRGGDHTPFALEGYAAVRFSTPNENYEHQHSATDTIEFMSIPYLARVIRINGAVAASLALAPAVPVVMTEIKTGPNKGRLTPMLSRGKTRYDAQLKWTYPGPDANVKGFAIVMRPTTAPFWEQEIYVGKVNEYLLENVSIDEVRFGVKAIGVNGLEGMAAAYVQATRPKRKIETVPEVAATTSQR